jgi:hypothetical protein
VCRFFCLRWVLFVSLFLIWLIKKYGLNILCFADVHANKVLFCIGWLYKGILTYMCQHDHFMYYVLFSFRSCQKRSTSFSLTHQGLIPKKWTRMYWKRKVIYDYMILFSFRFQLMKCAFIYICNTKMYGSKELF